MSLLGTGINVAKPVISIQTLHLILVIGSSTLFRYKQTSKDSLPLKDHVLHYHKNEQHKHGQNISMVSECSS